ncbi:MAG: hypothetical protein R6V34_02440 [Bacteroidales bacterium]
MILIVILIVCSSHQLFSQNCTDLIKTEYDEVTDITVISMKDRMYIEKDGQRKVSIYVAQKIENGEKEAVLTYPS